jgi:four helix bundle protein
MKNYRSLIVWQKAHAVALEVYRITKQFPREETYHLSNQLRRAAVSVASNIAEGTGRFTQRDFAHYLQVAMGSNQEIEYLVLLSCDLDYISQEVHDKLNAEVNKVRAMLIKLISNMRGERETDRKKENKDFLLNA